MYNFQSDYLEGCAPEILEELIKKCKRISNTKKILHNDIYDEIIELIIQNKFDEKLTEDVLVEIYRFGFYSEVKTSLDPRGDVNFKLSVLINLKNALEKNELNDEIISKVREANNFMREFIDNPISFIETEIKFYSEHPNAKF